MNKEEFWNNKILRWENSRYGRTPHNAVQARMSLARELLESHFRGRSILDLGCGSGLLLQTLRADLFASLKGLDFSACAIKEARKNCSLAQFAVGGVSAVAGEKFELLLALGLTDWLNDEELNILFSGLRGRDFVLSFSSNEPLIKNWLHRAYVQLHYGWRSQGYVPRYFSQEKLRQIAHRHGYGKIYFFKNPRLGIGRLASNVALPGWLA